MGKYSRVSRKKLDSQKKRIGKISPFGHSVIFFGGRGYFSLKTNQQSDPRKVVIPPQSHDFKLDIKDRKTLILSA